MSYRLGNNKEIEEIGKTLPLTCPKCKGKVSFSVYSNKGFDLIPEFPIIKNKTVFFLVCPSCASVYGVDEALGSSFKKGEKLSIGNFDFKELEVFDV